MKLRSVFSQEVAAAAAAASACCRNQTEFTCFPIGIQTQKFLVPKTTSSLPWFCSLIGAGALGVQELAIIPLYKCLVFFVNTLVWAVTLKHVWRRFRKSLAREKELQKETVAETHPQKHKSRDPSAQFGTTQTIQIVDLASQRPASWPSHWTCQNHNFLIHPAWTRSSRSTC